MRLKTVPEGSPCEPYELAPGVKGVAVRNPNFISIIWIEGDGTGKVGRFLDKLSRVRGVAITGVVSRRLADMLRRRGWEPVDVWFPSPEFPLAEQEESG